ncbi:S1 family peptidase [Streptomyces sp. N2-109]|uniref:S1 family peptidase n=1 Tax=Streptomyces gossypii TaxID=2883101 RepID=A0ABT2K2M9_9ACTN|nr:S1 family peptidase [Streptomyces gossypii]MCT2594419.1 S1 family peptidase [Streptomyces gossypii]
MRLRRIVPAVIAAVVAALTLTAAPAATAAAPASSASAFAIRGGDPLYSDTGAVCTVGFNARGGSEYYGIMAGHCALGSQTWYADPARTVVVGVTRRVSFPGGDHALIRYTNSEISYPGEVSIGGGQVRDITGAANPLVGQSVCQVTRTTGMHCGTVTSLNATVRYPEGVVYGLIRTNLCSEPGASGAPLISGNTALAVGSAASGNCSTGGTTFHQPVVEVLSAYGLTIY